MDTTLMQDIASLIVAVRRLHGPPIQGSRMANDDDYAREVIESLDRYDDPALRTLSARILGSIRRRGTPTH